jgi:hypothetical protein
MWENSLQICLPKDEPNLPIKINQIHWIQLVPAALNMGFKIIWGHEMMHWAIKAGHMTDFQLGGCSGYMYISAILMKRVSYDLCQLTQTSAIIFDNDQTAAYNQMIPSQCMILSAREGVNEAAIETQLAVLRNCEYWVKSATESHQIASKMT